MEFLNSGKQGSAAPDPGSPSNSHPGTSTHGFHVGALALDGGLESCLLTASVSLTGK